LSDRTLGGSVISSRSSNPGYRLLLPETVHRSMARACVLRDGALKKRASSGRGRGFASQDDGSGGPAETLRDFFFFRFDARGERTAPFGWSCNTGDDKHSVIHRQTRDSNFSGFVDFAVDFADLIESDCNLVALSRSCRRLFVVKTLSGAG
jgi:hypothetical protein